MYWWTADGWPLSEHSQMTATRHPESSNSRITLRSLSVCLDFFAPEFHIWFRQTEQPATMTMTMPVTAVNKNDGSVFWEYEIWCTGKPFIGNSIPVSLREQPLADGKLDLGIAISDTRHHTAAGITINYVCHSVMLGHQLPVRLEFRFFTTSISACLMVLTSCSDTARITFMQTEFPNCL